MKHIKEFEQLMESNIEAPENPYDQKISQSAAEEMIENFEAYSSNI